MDWLTDLLRMKIVNSVNNRKGGGIPWSKIAMYIVISKYPIITLKLNETIIPYMSKKLLGEKKDPEKITIDNAKSVIKMSLKEDNILFKNILAKHKYEFDQLTLKNETSCFISKSKTIELAKDIHLQLSFDTTVIEKDKEGKDIQVTKKSTNLSDSIGYVYSNVLSIKELNDFITDNYKPIVKKVNNSN